MERVKREVKPPLHYSDRLQQELQHVYDFIREHQQIVAARLKERFDANRRSAEWEVGILVLMSTKAHPRWRQSRKQEEKYYGPYLVEALQGPNALKLRGLLLPVNGF